ncbi:hypothetical protein A2U01_0115944, partial [Trifolium medium]|nr:hypothetical protein [Trifolium medium]
FVLAKIRLSFFNAFFGEKDPRPVGYLVEPGSHSP